MPSRHWMGAQPVAKGFAILASMVASHNMLPHLILRTSLMPPGACSTSSV
jgi:hypothetical protein